MSETAVKAITFAHSPDPDDAYMFYGFHTGAVKLPGYDVRHHLEDIQTLNERAFRSEFEITAVSAHAFAHLSDKYWALSCGASVGRKYGPMLVRRKGQTHWGNGRIAIPGQWTTAALALNLWLASEERDHHFEKIVVPFDQIMNAVKSGQFDAGLIIHEGQLTYERDGLEKFWDAGEWWHAETGLPLPLGLDVVRKDLGKPLAQAISKAFRQSIEYANAHRKEAVAYALQYGRGLDTALADRFIGMYVNDDTLAQGDEVQKGLRTLYDRAFAKKLIPAAPDLTFV